MSEWPGRPAPETPVIDWIDSDQETGPVGPERSTPKRHGHSTPESPTYVSRKMMLQRCYNSKREDFLHYGARGITVCERWRKSFSNFLEDMGERPPGTTLGRIDHNGNYCPENCVWQTPPEQVASSLDVFTVDGESRTLRQWAKHLDISYKTLLNRRWKGWGRDAFRVKKGERRK